jgi:hypothetical protein
MWRELGTQVAKFQKILISSCRPTQALWKDKGMGVGGSPGKVPPLPYKEPPEGGRPWSSAAFGTEDMTLEPRSFLGRREPWM